MTRHLALKAALVLLALLSLASPYPVAALNAASPLTQLSMTSQAGDYIGEGRNYLFNADDGVFTANASTSTSGGQADYVTVSFNQGGSGENWSLTFGTNHYGTALVPGTYTMAQRAPFAATGHPGLDVNGDGRGSNTLTGTFTVFEAVFDYSGSQPKVVSFAASFEQHSEGATPALTGTIYYNSYTHPPVTDTSAPVTTFTPSGTVGKYGRYSGPVQITLTATDPDGASDVAATYYHLDGGVTQTYTAPFAITGSALHTVNYWSVDKTGNTETPRLQQVWIDTSGPATVPALTQLSMTSDPGDYIGLGNTYLYNAGDGTFTASASASVVGGKADSISLTFISPGYANDWNVDLNTTQIGTGLIPGEYDNAQRAAFTSYGHPGLDVYGDGRGSDTVTGKFTILDAVFDYSVSPPKVVSFAATFEQHSEGATPALHGAIYYNSTAYPTYFPLSSVLFTPPALPGGNTGMGMVTLAQAAGAGGQTVTLTSNTPSLASVPASVTVAAGTATATFPISTSTVTTNTPVTITGTGGGASASAILTIQPPSAVALVLSAASITGGQNLTATVSLNGPAPAGGAVVTFVSSNPSLAAVPASVMVPQGATSATVTVQTFAVNVTSTATISATENGATFSVVLTLTPPPAEPTHILWKRTDGTISLWGINAAGGYSYHNYGPYPGWAATALATGSNGHCSLLWNHGADGTISLWDVDPSGSFTQHTYGPYAGWAATALATGPDNAPRVAWTHGADGQLSLWRVNPDGSYSFHNYGPYPGWSARSLSVGPNNAAFLLWTYAGTGDFGDPAPSGKAALWNVSETGSFSYQLYGPYSGWNAETLATGPDGSSHIAWTRIDDSLSLWLVAPDGTYTFQNYGPYGGWTEAALAVGHDNIPRLLWNHTSDSIASVWSVNPGGSFGYINYGPFSGWTAIALSAQP